MSVCLLNSISPSEPTPRMVYYLRDGQALIDVTIQHRLNEIDRGVAHDPWYPKLAVHDLVDAVEGVFLVDECV